jgi:N utilization substance protein B
MPGARRLSRNYALQFLYQLELNPDFSAAAIERFWSNCHASAKVRAFAMQLVERTRAEQPAIDAAVSGVLEHWKLGRLTIVVRNVLRLAYCELILIGDVPYQAVIDEAVELTHDFMDEPSARFVNSVLERCWRAHRGEPLAPLPSAAQA